MFQEHLWQDIAITVAMWILLGLAAWFDAHGATVPDAYTVPYAILGVGTAILHEHYWLGLCAAGVLVLCVLPWRSTRMQQINAFVVEKAYGANRSRQKQEMRHMEQESLMFERKAGGAVNRAMPFLYLLIIGALVTAATKDCWDKHSMISVGVVSGGIAVFFFASCISKLKTARSPEPIMVFGGADILVVVGMVGYYGVPEIIYAMAASLCLCVLSIMINRLVKRNKSPIIPLLPPLFISCPLQLYVVFAIYHPTTNALKALLALI